MMQLIGNLASRCDYHGGWLIGLEVNRLRGLAGEGGRDTLERNCVEFRFNV